MALPAYVAPNELIASAWGNSVVDNLDELHDDITRLEGERLAAGPHFTRYVPGSNQDVSVESWATWITFGNITIPSWVDSVVITVHLTGVLNVGASLAQWQLRTWITGQADTPDIGALLELPASTSLRTSISWGAELDIDAPGTRSLQVQVQRTTGSTGMRINTGSIATATFGYRG